MKNPYAFEIKMNGQNPVSYDGAAAKSINITPSSIGAAPTNHTHTKANITDFPTSMKNPYALTISLNGTSQEAYDGGAAKSINITAGGVGAYTKTETDEKFKNFCPYAIGDIYLTTLSTNPATKYLGTTWQKIEGRFLLGTSGSGASKQIGGSNSKTIAQANLPNIKLTVNSFSLSRGTMNIIGTHHYIPTWYSDDPSGAFYEIKRGSNTVGSAANNGGVIGFDASKSWTGSTNSVSPQTSALGSGSALDITPSYYTVHMWLRLT